MKKFANYEETTTYADFPKIPSGGYLAVIKAAEVKTFSGQNGDFEKLEISFDITSGEYKDYYANQYRSSTATDKKWKGKVSIYIPTDDGSEMDAVTKRRFKTVIEAVEESNSGYHWDWDEKKLKGKKCGVVLRNKEWEYNGKTGWSAIPYSIVSCEAVNNGTFYMPKDLPLNNHAAPVQAEPTKDFEEITEEDLPF